MKLFGLTLLMVHALSACSLEQKGRDGDGYARIRLNTRNASGSSMKLGTIPGVAPPTASSYYVIDVEGEGIPRQTIEPSKCVKASPISSAMVPALLQSGEPERTEIELLVPVGANRKIRIIRVDLNFPPGSSLPMWAESPFRYQMRTPGYSIAGDLFILAESEIPFLNGDQSVTLVEKATAFPIPNQCVQNGGGSFQQPFLGNSEVELLGYQPWAGFDGNGQPQPYRIWESNSYPHYMLVQGDFKNRTASVLYPSGINSPTPIPNPSLIFSVGSSPSPFPVLPWSGSGGSGALQAEEKRFYQWVFPVYSPAPGLDQAKVSFPYSTSAGEALKFLTQTFSREVHAVPAPVSLMVPIKMSGYSNLFRSELIFSGAGTLSPLNSYSSLFSNAVNADFGAFEGTGTLNLFTEISPSPSPAGTPVPPARSLAVDGSGNVFLGYPGTLKRFSSGGTESGGINFTSFTGIGGMDLPHALAVRNAKIFFVTGGTKIYHYSDTLPAPGIVPTPMPVLFDAGAGSSLSGLAFDPQGHLYVSDSSRHRVFRLSANEVFTYASSSPPAAIPVTSAMTIAGVVDNSGAANGALGTNRLQNPAALAHDNAGRLFVVDNTAGLGGTRVRRVELSSLMVTTLPTPVQTGFSSLKQIAARDDEVFVTEKDRHVIHRIRNGGISVYAGRYGAASNLGLDRLATDVELKFPEGLALGLDRLLFVADDNTANGFRVKRITPSCPFSRAGAYFPLPFQNGQKCHFYYRVFEAGSAPNLNTLFPIARLEVSESVSGKSGFLTPPLSGVSTYSAGLMRTAEGIPYDATLSATPMNVTGPLVAGLSIRNGSAWALSSPASLSTPYAGDPNYSIEQVELRSEGGMPNTDVLSVTAANSPNSQIVLPRRVNNLPLRGAEVVLKGLNGADLEYRKQKLKFIPINPAQVDLRLERNDVVLGTGFTICTGDSGSYKLRAFYGTTELPLKDDGATTLSVTGFSPGSVTLTSNSNVLGLQLNMSSAFTAGSITFTVNSPRLLGIGGSGQETYIPLVNSKTWTGVVVGAGCSVGAGATPTPAPALDFQN